MVQIGFFLINRPSFFVRSKLVGPFPTPAQAGAMHTGLPLINRPPFSDVTCHFSCRRNGERIGRTSRKGLGVSCGNHKKCSEANCCTGEVIHATSRLQEFSFDIKMSYLKPVSSSAPFIFSAYSEGSVISCGLGYRCGETRNDVPLLSNVMMNHV
jgi:hypothetical protein